MSFEEMGSTKHPCPCGKSTYTVTHFMDDWNRSKYEEKMNCRDCRKKYVLDSYPIYDKGLASTATRWIKEKDAKEASSYDLEAEKLIEKAENIAKSKYLKTWLEHFSKFKTNKVKWEELTFNGKRYPSLGTFYKHIKSDGVEEYLKSYFNLDNAKDFEAISKILNINDIKILNLFKKAVQSLKKAKTARGR